MSFRPKMIQDRAKGRKEALSMTRGFEAAHGSLSLSGGWMLVLRAVVQALVLEVSELRTRHGKLTQSGETTAKMSKEWGK